MRTSDSEGPKSQSFGCSPIRNDMGKGTSSHGHRMHAQKQNARGLMIVCSGSTASGTPEFLNLCTRERLFFGNF